MLCDFSLKLPESMRATFLAMAESRGITGSEYVRRLIEVDIEQERRRFEVLAQIFGQAGPSDHNGQGGT